MELGKKRGKKMKQGFCMQCLYQLQQSNGSAPHNMSSTQELNSWRNEGRKQKI